MKNIISELEALASSSPFVNGDAVYSARAIVGYTENVPVENNKNHEFLADTNTSNSEGIEVKAFPNPANDKLFIDITGLNNEVFKFIIFNSLGIKVKEVNIQTKAVIDINKLSKGLYFYQIM